jgi:hypothetical protein
MNINCLKGMKCPECGSEGPTEYNRASKITLDPTQNLKLLKAYQYEHGLDTEQEIVRDLLSDLMHICDYLEIDFEDELRIATDNFDMDLSSF